MLKPILIIAVGSLIFGMVSFGGQGDPPLVEFTFSDPFSFTDVRYRGGEKEDITWILTSLSEYIQTLCAKYLIEGDYLTVTITDIDLAGSFVRGVDGDYRKIGDTSPPVIRLVFRLVDINGMVKAKGLRRLHNRCFINSTAGSRADQLRYEKGLLKKWVRKELR